LKGIEKNRYLILPGFNNRLLFFLSNFLGSGVYPLMDFLVKGALKAKGKQEGEN